MDHPLQPEQNLKNMKIYQTEKNQPKQKIQPFFNKKKTQKPYPSPCRPCPGSPATSAPVQCAQ